MLTLRRVLAVSTVVALCGCANTQPEDCVPGDEAVWETCESGAVFGLDQNGRRWHWKSTQKLPLSNISRTYRVELRFGDGSSLALPPVAPPKPGSSAPTELNINLSSNTHLGLAQLVFTDSDSTSSPPPSSSMPVRLYATPSWGPDTDSVVFITPKNAMNPYDLGAARSVAISPVRSVLTLSEQSPPVSNIRSWIHDEALSEFSGISKLDLLLGSKSPYPVALSINFSQKYSQVMIAGDGGSKTILSSRRCQFNTQSSVSCEPTNIELKRLDGTLSSASYQDVMIKNGSSLDILIAPNSTVNGVAKLLAYSIPAEGAGMATELTLPADLTAAQSRSVKLAAGSLQGQAPGEYLVYQNGSNAPLAPPVVLRREGSQLVKVDSISRGLATALKDFGNVAAMAIADVNGDQMADLILSKPGSDILYLVENQSVTKDGPQFGAPTALLSAAVGRGFIKIDRIAAGLIRDSSRDSKPGCSECADLAIISEQPGMTPIQEPGGLMMALINKPQ